MPELPDLHVFAENLKKRILERTIEFVSVGNPYKVDRPETFCEKLTGTFISGIVRDGKELRFLLNNGNSFNIHLMLSGKFFICGKSEAGKINARIAALFFDGGDAFVVADYQGLCKITLNARDAKSPDAMSEGFSFEYFSGAIKKSPAKNIKALLIDQSVVRGIGNAYVDEILWKAGISPESASGKIPDETLRVLYDAVPFVLNGAIESIKEISPDIISGEIRDFLNVHNPAKKTAPDGGKIIIKTIASKKTYFSEKQKLFK